MKQIKLLLATMMAFVCTSGAWADYTIGYLTFSGNMLSKIANGAEDVVVPETYVDNNGTTYTVTDVSLAFLTGCNTLRSITFPKTLTIDNSGMTGALFRSLSTLEEVIFAEGCPMEEIFQNTFLACSNLSRVVLPDGLKTIGSNAFRSCSSLTEITLGPNVTSIGTYAFGACTRLSSITITGNSVVRAAPSAFANLPSSKTLTVPYGMKDVYMGLPEWSGFTITETAPLPGDVEVEESFNHNSTGGEVSSWVETWRPESEQQTWTRILLEGNGYYAPTGLNTTDWKMIRKWMGGGETAGTHSSGYHVHYLDMAGAIFVADDTPFYTDAESSYSISQGVVPDMAFAECVNLDTLILPRNTSHIGRSVFYGTRNSLVVQVPWDTPVTDLDDQCFGVDDADVSGMTLIVPRGSLEAYQEAEHWKAFGTIIELPIGSDEERVTVICSDPSAAVLVLSNASIMGTVDAESGQLAFIMQKTARLNLRVPTRTHVVSKIFINQVDETANFDVSQVNNYTNYSHVALTEESNVVYVQLEPVPENATLSIVANMGHVICSMGSHSEQFIEGGTINVTVTDDEPVYILFFSNAMRDDKVVGTLSHVYRDGVDILSQLTPRPQEYNYGDLYSYSPTEAVDGRHPQFVLVYDAISEDDGMLTAALVPSKGWYLELNDGISIGEFPTKSKVVQFPKGSNLVITPQNLATGIFDAHLYVNGVDRSSEMVDGTRYKELHLQNVTEDLLIEAKYELKQLAVGICSSPGGTVKANFTRMDDVETNDITPSDGGGQLVTEIKPGTDMTFIFTPQQGYELGLVFCHDQRYIGEGTDFDVQLQADGTYQFVLPADQIVSEKTSVIAIYKKTGTDVNYDVNNDGSVTIADAVLIVDHILNE